MPPEIPLSDKVIQADKEELERLSSDPNVAQERARIQNMILEDEEVDRGVCVNWHPPEDLLF